jgi:hypothetical protein
VTKRQWLTAVTLGLIVTALFWVDPIFIPLALAGPLAWGAFAGSQKLPWQWPLTVSLVAGLGAVVTDFAINHEDVAFHLAMTFTLCAIAWSAWSISRRFVT